MGATRTTATVAAMLAVVCACSGSSSQPDAAPGGDRDGAPVTVLQDAQVAAGADRPATTDGPRDVAATPDAPVVTSADGAAEGKPDARTSDAAGGCVTQRITLGRGGTSSSCSFPVPAGLARDRINLVLGGTSLCRQGSNNCTSRGGWFWFGDEVALCDATCLSWEASRANLVLEAGCAGESCFVACKQEGGPCGDGINSCCAGFRCTGGMCATCGRGGQACAGNSDCCTGSCQNGVCVGGLGSACVSQPGCTQGQCREGRCQCAADQILCSAGCVSFTDPNNCRGCGNVCPTGSGRVCTADGCVCDPASAFPDECNGTCVNKATDRTNCGTCFNHCPRLEQVCVAGRCGCPPGQMDCNGSCVDVSSSGTHCGVCNRSCVFGAEVCNAGSCDCAPGSTRCSGACVNLKTNRLHCNGCGMACVGNKTCQDGACR